MTKRLAEIEGEPEVGRYYLVPCVYSIAGNLAPIIGPEHEDHDYIGTDELHYHYDLRFVSAREIKNRVDYIRMVSPSPVTVAPEEATMIALVIGLGNPVEKRLKCLRPMPTFPLNFSKGGKPPFWMRLLEDAYKDTPLNCLRCPHRGMPLSKELADKEGNVVCPGHGLKWNLETGALVSRLAAQPEREEGRRGA